MEEEEVSALGVEGKDLYSSAEVQAEARVKVVDLH